VQRVFEDYLHHLDIAADKYQLREAMKVFAGQFGFSSFAYLTLPKTTRNKIRVVSTYHPHWIAHYFCQRYELSDPILAHARSVRRSLIWPSEGNGSEICAARRRFFDEATEFGIGCGYTVPIWEGSSPVAAMTFAADRRTSEYISCISRNDLLLDFASCCFHREIGRKLNRSYVMDRKTLTPRQRQVMDLSAAGKSTVDIGQILSITPRTAVYHIENVKAKYGVRTIAQAVVRYKSEQGR
jgi:LuxR family transcriptional activator of conjugal transfer of Ti plasmids